MELAECQETLYAVARVRLPSHIRVGNAPDPVDVASGMAEEGRNVPLGAREKISELESYLLETAEARQRAHEARLYISGSLRNLRSDYRDIEGWEAHMNGQKSEAAKHEARRKVNKDLVESIESAEWLVKELDKQISRLQHDDDVVSRAYTFITGG